MGVSEGKILKENLVWSELRLVLNTFHMGPISGNCHENDFGEVSYSFSCLKLK